MSQSLKSQRAPAFKSQNGKCYYCGIQMWLNDPHDHCLRSGISSKEMPRIRCTVEHLQARTNGGSDAIDNLATACWFYNQARHRRPKPLSSRKFRRLVTSRMLARKWHPAQFHQ